jgi:hypothetical protein
MTDDSPHELPDLYSQIVAGQKRCEPMSEQEILALPLFEAVSTDAEGMRWRPKARCPGALREEAAADQVVSISRVSLIGRQLFLRFELKSFDPGPVRCVVVLNGQHSLRISIRRGKIGELKTYATVALDVQHMQADSQKKNEMDVEIIRDSTLLFYSTLIRRPGSISDWIPHLSLWVARSFGFFFSKLRFRPVRVEATRVLEESFRIKTR